MNKTNAFWANDSAMSLYSLNESVSTQELALRAFTCCCGVPSVERCDNGTRAELYSGRTAEGKWTAISFTKFSNFSDLITHNPFHHMRTQRVCDRIRLSRKLINEVSPNSNQQISTGLFIYKTQRPVFDEHKARSSLTRSSVGVLYADDVRGPMQADNGSPMLGCQAAHRRSCAIEAH